MPKTVQPALFEVGPAMPAGFRYRPDLISPGEEAALAAWLQTLEFRPYEFQGYLAHRRVTSFGLRYDDRTRQVGPAEPIPAQLLALRDKVGAFVGLAPQALRHVLINEYRPGVQIGWHRDRPQFQDVAGVSLLAPCLFRLRRRRPGGFDRASMTLEPRSAYVMQGAAREEWEHSIPPHEQFRYSITFRTLRPRLTD